MTWTFPPTGLTEETFAGDNPTYSVPSSTATKSCDNGAGFSECQVNADFTGSETFGVGPLVALIADSYDWYSLHAEFFFPDVFGAFDEGCGPVESPCGDSVVGTSTGAGDYQPVALADGAALSTSGSDLDVPTVGWYIPTPGGGISDISDHAVENPSPTAPIPDAYGNTAGRVFWTRAQIEAVTLTVDWAGHYHDPNSAGHWLVTVRAWNGTIPRPALVMCLDSDW